MKRDKKEYVKPSTILLKLNEKANLLGGSYTEPGKAPAAAGQFSNGWVLGKQNNIWDDDDTDDSSDDSNCIW